MRQRKESNSLNGVELPKLQSEHAKRTRNAAVTSWSRVALLAGNSRSVILRQKRVEILAESE